MIKSGTVIIENGECLTMNILLFGVSNVGKTTVGKLLAEKLGYDFYDLDEEVKKYYSVTLEQFVHTGTLKERDRMRGAVIDRVMEQKGDKVFAISPISYPENFRHHLARPDVLAIDLQDTATHIFQRLVFSDEHDVIYEDEEYKNAHMRYYLSEIRKDIRYYAWSYGDVKNKFRIKNDPPETVVDRIIRKYGLTI